MIKTETCVLKNGLRLVLVSDPSKNKTHMEIITKFGGLTRNFEVNNEKYTILPGIAHLLEHTLVENTIYGNMFDYLSDKYVLFNATTSQFQTSFYMNTVYDAKEHLKELIHIVNETSFDEEGLEKTKKPVLEEIKRGQDRRYDDFRLASTNAVLTNIEMVNNLGIESDIEACTVENLKLIHDVFYRPQNQILALAGNFDIDEFKQIIEASYDEIEFKDYDYKLLDKKEEDKISKGFIKIVRPELDEIVKITYKINIRDLTPKEKVKLSFYMSFFLDYNFDDSSLAYKKVKELKLSPYSIHKSVQNIFDEYLLISVILYGSDVEKFKEIVFDVFDKKPIDEEMFNLYIKQTTIDLIIREDHYSRMIYPFISNVLDYNYYDVDKLSDIEEMSKEDCLTMLNKLDFSKYSIAIQSKE